MFATSSLIAWSISILGWLVETTIVATILFGAAWLFCRSRGIGPAARHVIWLVVLLKMLAPPVVHWPWSRSFGVPIARIEQQAKSIEQAERKKTSLGGKVDSKLAFETKPVVQIAQERSDCVLDQVDPETAGIAFVEPVERTTEMEDEASVENEPAEESTAVVASVDAASSRWAFVDQLRGFFNFRSLGQSLALIWVIGTIAFGARQLLKILAFELRLRNARPAPEWLESEAAAMGERLGVRAPEIVVIEGRGTPLVWCLGEPKLVVPVDLVKSLDVSSWRGVLAHELAHLKRKDHWIRRAELAGGFVWWWCPLYWAVVRRLEAESELACDAWVVWALPEDRINYAESLFHVCSSLSDTLARTPTPALGVAGAGLFFERRLTMILRESISRRPTLASLLAAAVLALLALPSWSRATLAPSGGEALLHANFRAGQEKPEPPETQEAEEKKVEKRIEIIVDSDDDDDKDKDDDDKADVKIKKPLKINRKAVRRKYIADDKVAKDAEALSEKLTKRLESQLGPDSAFAKKMESLAKDLEKKFGEDSDFNKKMESLGEEIEKQFGENSEFAKKIEDLGKELETKFGGEFTEDIEKMVKDVEKEFGPGSNFEQEMKNLAKEIAESVTIKLKGEADKAEIVDDKAVIVNDKLKRLGAMQADQARQAEQAQRFKAQAAERAAMAAKKRADRDAAVAARDAAAADRAKLRAESLARAALRLKIDRDDKVEAAANPKAKKSSSRIQAIEKQIEQLSRELKMLKEQSGEDEDEPDDGDDN